MSLSDPDTSATLDRLAAAAGDCPLATPCPADFDLADDVGRLLHCRLVPQARALTELARRVSRACSAECPLRPSLDQLGRVLDAARPDHDDGNGLVVRTLLPAEPSSGPPRP